MLLCIQYRGLSYTRVLGDLQLEKKSRIEYKHNTPLGQGHGVTKRSRAVHHKLKIEERAIFKVVDRTDGLSYQRASIIVALCRHH